MDNFAFYLPTRIYFGRGGEKNIGEILKSYGAKNVLLHYGSGSIKKSGLFDTITNALRLSGINYTELGGVVPNPRLSKVYEGISLCRKNNIDFILAAGGGSVIDSAKAIALGTYYGGDVWDYFKDNSTKVEKALPIGVVLTIAAAGSESSYNLVITEEEGKLKRSYFSDLLRPKFAVLNPELCFTLPQNQIANGIADIIAHMLERYFTPQPCDDINDRLLEGGIKTMIKYGPLTLKNPANYDYWAQVMWTGCIAHNNMLSCGRKGDWASHALEHEISALYDVAHGAGLSVIFPAWMKYVYKNDVTHFAKYASRVFDMETDLYNPEITALKGIAALKDFFARLNLPVSAQQIGMREEDIEIMAQKLINRDKSGYVGNFVKLGLEDIINIYKLAFIRD